MPRLSLQETSSVAVGRGRGSLAIARRLAEERPSAPLVSSVDLWEGCCTSMTHRVQMAALVFTLALPACSDSGSKQRSPAGDGGPSAVDLDFTKFDAAVEAFLTEHRLKG